MLEQSIRQATPITSAKTESKDIVTQIQAKINKLHAESRQGLWHIAVFLLISLGALACRGINVLDHVSEGVRVFLGAPPAPYLIHIVLAVSTVSALIILCGRLYNEAEPGRKWEQTVYRAVFYAFYFFSNALDQFFLIIFIAGMAVLFLEHYHIWTHFKKAIRQEKETMRKLSLWPLAASNWQN